MSAQSYLKNHSIFLNGGYTTALEKLKENANRQIR